MDSGFGETTRLSSTPRMTLAETSIQKVYLLWKNETLLCVCANEERAVKEAEDLMRSIGGEWDANPHHRYQWLGPRVITIDKMEVYP